MMPRKRVFIDGQHGTVGLQIHDRLKSREDIELIGIPESDRKVLHEKRKKMDEADVIILCLPDEAARETVSVIGKDKVVIDGSTAHRTAKEWVYGLPELNSDQRNKIIGSNRISVPGCYATGFNLLLHPLTSRKIIGQNSNISAYAITGYSGGGKTMINEYEKSVSEFHSARPKNLNLTHKHLPEMMHYGMIDQCPIFTPIVANFYQGMLVFLPLHKSLFVRRLDQSELIDFYQEYFANEQFVRVAPKDEIMNMNADFVQPEACNNTNSVEILIFGNDHDFLAVARLDNLGKGAAGAAVQNLNLKLNTAEDFGLVTR